MLKETQEIVGILKYFGFFRTYWDPGTGLVQAENTKDFCNIYNHF